MKIILVFILLSPFILIGMLAALVVSGLCIGWDYIDHNLVHWIK
jgi:hypothetical protein